MIKVLGLALYGPQAASHRIRLAQYVPGLAKLGIQLEVQSLLNDDYVNSRFQGSAFPLVSVLSSAWHRLQLLLGRQRFDFVIVHCELFPLLPGWLERSLLRVPYIYDFDDAFFLRYRTGRLSRLKPILGNKFENVMASAAAVTAGNSYLVAYAEQHNSNAVLLPSVVDTDVYTPLALRDNQHIFTVGWVGSPSTAAYLELLAAPLIALAKGGPVRFVVIGGKAPIMPGVEVVELPWQADNEVQLINGFDVGVMPLPDDQWARGKCAFKLIQYMACGVPVVASRVGANVDVVTVDCGFLVKDSADWAEALSVLRDRPGLRSVMGAAARLRVVNEYSLACNLPLLADVVRKTVIKD